jgi:hypothetical protein
MTKINKRQAIAVLATALVLLSLVPAVDAGSSDYKVLFDETRINEKAKISNTDWEGFSDFCDVLKDNGFSVSKISTRPITYEKLQRYAVFIMLSNHPSDPSLGYYSNDEVDAIERFVKNGGGLFLVREIWRGGSAYDNWSTNAVANRFGVNFAKDGRICDSTDYRSNVHTPVISNVKSHTITKVVSSFCINIGIYIKDTGSSKALAYTDSDAWFDDLWDNWGNDEKESDEITGSFPVLSVMEYRKGKIVFMGDGSTFINLWLDQLDNEQLGLNIVKWLANVPDTGSIDVTSYPSDAKIYLDGEYKGTTPKTIPGVSTGTHTIKLEKSGCEDWSDSVYVEAGETEEVVATLIEIPKTGAIEVSSYPSNAKIYLDGNYKGTTHKTIFGVSTGSHAIKLKKSGYEDWSDSVYVKAGETKEVVATLIAIPKTGSIEVSSYPSSARIYLDEKYKGTTSKTIFDVSIGSHAIKLKKSGYEDWSDSVYVKASETEEDIFNVKSNTTG